MKKYSIFSGYKYYASKHTFLNSIRTSPQRQKTNSQPTQHNPISTPRHNKSHFPPRAHLEKHQGVPEHKSKHIFPHFTPYTFNTLTHDSNEPGEVHRNDIFLRDRPAGKPLFFNGRLVALFGEFCILSPVRKLVCKLCSEVKCCNTWRSTAEWRRFRPHNN